MRLVVVIHEYSSERLCIRTAIQLGYSRCSPTAACRGTRLDIRSTSSSRWSTPSTAEAARWTSRTLARGLNETSRERSTSRPRWMTPSSMFLRAPAHDIPAAARRTHRARSGIARPGSLHVQPHRVRLLTNRHTFKALTKLGAPIYLERGRVSPRDYLTQIRNPSGRRHVDHRRPSVGAAGRTELRESSDETKCSTILDDFIADLPYIIDFPAIDPHAVLRAAVAPMTRRRG